MHQNKFLLTIAVVATAIAGCTSNTLESSRSSTVSKEVQAKESINSILFDQRTHYIEYQAFTTSVKDLKAIDKKLDTPNYRYSLKAKPSKEKGVVVLAASKRPYLRSFTGVVFAVETGKEFLTISEICETNVPSKQAPAAPKMPKRPSDRIQCPAGSRSTSSIVALQ